jgi:rfaE bifunctional protein nucleotidyltransferase chain/domain
MPSDPSLKIVPFEEIPGLVQYLGEQNGYSFVTTNGCFDLIHPGHVALLQAAREKGDILIVGVNSDAAIRRLKGPSRPVMNEVERLLMLSSLECVDFVTIIDEDEIARPLIEAVRPDVHVKGGEYRGRCKEQPLVKKMGSEMCFIEMSPELSTSDIVRRIRNMGEENASHRRSEIASSCPHCGKEIGVDLCLRILK